ncbi:MAG: threonylcarbamoyl-AMP synthase [Candidatus Margulisbacteria bacterium]|nr:threonylcarbamoyl-AMP synthase [Candidatus Margulisiibacteriota bacterium]
MLISWENAKEILSKNGVVALPTDTVYGLAANPFSKKAVQKIYQVKGRSFHKPLVLMCSNIEQVKDLVANWSDQIEKLVEKYWPGPLTLIFKRNQGKVPKEVVVNNPTVGIRIPRHEPLLSLLSQLDFPLAVTSANRSGEKELLLAEEVQEVFNNKIDGIIKDDDSHQGVPSTILDVSVDPWEVLREGPIKEWKI